MKDKEKVVAVAVLHKGKRLSWKTLRHSSPEQVALNLNSRYFAYYPPHQCEARTALFYDFPAAHEWLRGFDPHPEETGLTP